MRKIFSFMSTLVMLAVISCICSNQSMAQSYTATTYKNPLTNITSTKVVSAYNTTPMLKMPAVSYPRCYTTNSVITTPTTLTDAEFYNSESIQFRPIKAKFVGIIVAKLDVKTDTVIESWETKNVGIYNVTADRSSISYTEYSADSKKIVKNWSLMVTGVTNDAVAWSVTALNDGAPIFIRIWKDGSMVVLEGADYHMLITGYNISQ